MILSLLSSYKRKKPTTRGARKKKKCDNTSNIDLIVLIEGDIDEICDTMWSVTEDMWGHIEDQYKLVQTQVQHGLKEIHVQASVIQASVATFSAKLTLPSMLVITIEVHAVPIPGGSQCFTTKMDYIVVPSGSNSTLNIATLPIQALHELHQGVSMELKIQEERALFVIKDIKSHIEKLTEDGSRAIQDRDIAIACRQQLEDAITQTCIELPKLLIQIEEASEEKVHRLAAMIKESKDEVE